MDPEEVRQALQGRIDAILTDGVEVVVGDESRTLSLVTLSSGDAAQDVDFALTETLDSLMAGAQGRLHCRCRRDVPLAPVSTRGRDSGHAPRGPYPNKRARALP